jgi:hypothetical protein
MKALSVMSLVLSFIAAVLAGGVYVRVRSRVPATSGSPNIEDLSARIARLEASIQKPGPRLERPPQNPDEPHYHPQPGPGSADLADLQRRVAALEGRPGTGRIEPRPQPRPNPEMVEVLKKRLTDPNLSVRQRATTLGSLRSQGANKADDIVDAGLALLGQAQEPNMRALILRNLQGAENPRLLPTVLGLLKLDADEDVRDEAARLLGEYVAQAEVKAALEAAATGDASDKVKRRAQAALNASR